MTAIRIRVINRPIFCCRRSISPEFSWRPSAHDWAVDCGEFGLITGLHAYCGCTLSQVAKLQMNGERRTPGILTKSPNEAGSIRQISQAAPAHSRPLRG